MDVRVGPQRRQRVKLWCWRLLRVRCRNAFKLVSLKGNQPWILIGRTDAEVEAPILWAADANRQTHWKRPWCWERLKAEGEKGDRGCDEWITSSILGNGVGQGRLVCCSFWGCKELDMTWPLNNNNKVGGDIPEEDGWIKWKQRLRDQKEYWDQQMTSYHLQSAPKYLSFLLDIVTFKVASLVINNKTHV